MSKPTLLALMPFGRRQVTTSTGSVEVDFDALYGRVLKPAATSAGFEISRADDLSALGAITSQIGEMLTRASAVLADVSSANANVLYELGIWHALGSGPTLLVGTRDSQIPFDIANMRVLMYSRDDLDDPRSFREHLEAGLAELISALGSTVGNPIDAQLQRLAIKPSEETGAFDDEARLRVQRASTVEQLVAVWSWARGARLSPGTRVELANRLADLGAETEAIAVLGGNDPQADYEVLQRRGLLKRRSGDSDGSRMDLLAALKLNPDDPETLGQLGGLARRSGLISLAVVYYSRAFEVAPSSAYIKAANAELQLIHGSQELALQWYRELAELSDLEKHRRDPWMQLIGSEALFALGDDEGAKRHYEGALSAGASASQVVSLLDQLEYFAQGDFRTESALRVLEWIKKPSEIATPSGEVAEGFTILHLSDTHFGSIGDGATLRNMHRFREGDENSFTLRESLADDLRDLSNQGQVDLSRLVLVVSGDLVYTAKSSEFDLVKAFLEGLCGDLGLSHERVVLVPGNHDVNWEESQLDKRRRFDNFLIFARSFYGAPLFAERYPLIHWDFSVDTPRPEPRNILQVCSLFNVTWIGLNSCVFETHQQHYGFVGERQLRAAEAHVSRHGGSRNPVVAVMHHHLHPYPEMLSAPQDGDVWLDLSIVRDSGQVERTIEGLGAILLLHGHKHKPQLRRTRLLDKYVSSTEERRGDLIVNGSGSAGVDERELEHGQGNHYSLIKVIPDREVVVNWRELGLHAGARWRTTNRWTLPLA